MRISKIGTQAIRVEMKKKRLTDELLATQIGICGVAARNQVNAMINGKRAILEDRLEALSVILGLDSASLIEPNKNKNEMLHAEYAAFQAYLNSIGVEIVPRYYWECTQKLAINNFEFMRKYFTADEKRRILAIREKGGCRRVKREKIALNSDPHTDIEYCQKFEPNKDSEEIFTLPKLGDLSGILYSIPAKIGGRFYLGYEIREDGKKKSIISHSELLITLRNVRVSVKALTLAAL